MSRRLKLVGALGGYTAMVGLFLPYFSTYSLLELFSAGAQEAAATTAVLLTALATLLHALGCPYLPFLIGIALCSFDISLLHALFSAHAMAILPYLQIGALLIPTGLITLTAASFIDFW